MAWRLDFEGGVCTLLRANGTINNLCSDRVLAGSSHEQLPLPAVVFDVAYRREIALSMSEWIAEVVVLTWSSESYDQAHELSDAVMEAMEGVNLTIGGVNVCHWRATNIEPFQIDMESGVKVFGVQQRCEAMLDVTP